MLLPTVKITFRKNGAFGIINEADFDSNVHKLFEENPAAEPVAAALAPGPVPAPVPPPPPPPAEHDDDPVPFKRGPGRPPKS